MQAHSTTADLIWPPAPEGHGYITQRLGSDVYTSTGWFPHGAQRLAAQCSQVTSVFFDADLVSLYMAIRSARGQEVPAKVQEKKELLYALDDDEVEGLKDILIEVASEALLSVTGHRPTLFLDSGWGVHAHYAYRGPHDVAVQTEQRRQMVRHLNIEAAYKINAMLPGVHCEKAFDATIDPGSRVARRPGTINRKCPSKPREVQVLDVPYPETMLDAAGMEVITERLSRRDLASQVLLERAAAAAAPAPAPDPEPTPAPAAPPKKERRADAKLQTERIDFSSVEVDGMPLRQLLAQLQPNEKRNVVCPFGGSSVGSAFVAKDERGRGRLTSNAMGVTYYDLAPAPKQQVAAAQQGGAPPAERPPQAKPKTGARVYAEIPVHWQEHAKAKAADGSTVLEPMGPRHPGKGKEAGCARLILEQDSMFDLWHDSFRGIDMDGDEPVTEHAWLRLLEVLQTDYHWSGPKGREFLDGVIRSVAYQRQRNPLQERLRSLRWDGVPRIDGWLDRVVYAPARAKQQQVANQISIRQPHPTLLRAFSRRWAIGFVARALQPGCDHDTQLILQGAEGFRKTTIFRSWVHDRSLFTNSRVDLRETKNAVDVLKLVWLVEDAELETSAGVSANTKKAMLSQSAMTARLAFRRDSGQHLAHHVMVGTTNDDGFLADSKGNRRYWPVRCPSIPHLPHTHPDQPRADTDWLVQHRDQLLAEAVAAFDAGEQWHLTDEEGELLAQQHQPFRSRTDLEELAEHVYSRNGGGWDLGFSMTEFAKRFDPDLSDSKINEMNAKLGAALRGAGFLRSERQKNGRSIWYRPLREGEAPGHRKGIEHTESTHTPEDRSTF